MSTDVKNVLFVAPNWLGDAVMSLPLLGYLSASPVMRIVVLSSGYTGRAYLGLREADELLVLSKEGMTRRLWQRRGTIRRLGLDGAVMLPPSFSSALTLWAARVPARVGYATDGRGILLSDALRSNGLRHEHISKNYLRLGEALLRRLGIDAPVDYEPPSIRVFANEREAVERLLERAGVSPARYAVIVPGATYGPTKSWPFEKYAELARMLSEELPVILSGTAAESSLCEGIASGSQNVYNLSGRTGLGELFALLEGASVVVANDSGAPHAAASLGVPVVVIFGSTSPQWTKPLGDAVDVVREPVHCSPCFLQECPTQLECYEAITPAAVFDRTMRMLRTGGETASIRGSAVARTDALRVVPSEFSEPAPTEESE